MMIRYIQSKLNLGLGGIFPNRFFSCSAIFFIYFAKIISFGKIERPATLLEMVILFIARTAQNIKA
jgi:hypothetical protein